MNERTSVETPLAAEPDLLTELLILSDGTVLAHNLTPAMAAVLTGINMRDQTLQQRAGGLPRSAHDS
jgi:hypothetical protein